MLFSPDLLLAFHGGPLPQAVIDQRPLWFALMAFLGATLVVRMAAFDILGGLLCGLLLLLVCVIVRDGMKELPKLSLVFGMLCGLNFFFYMLPLLANLISGRTERHTRVVGSASYDNTQEMTYTLVVRTTAFFDAKSGLLYNLQSAGMLMMPLCMLLGSYLGVTAHHEIQRHMPPLLGSEDSEVGDSEVGDAAGGDQVARAAASGRGNRNTRAATAYGSLAGRLTAATATNGPSQSRRWDPFARSSTGSQAFQGVAHKLAD